ncbi:MAG: 30S ribosomal protein S24e [Crenarchaeota archaeon]|nr:30S ribosomal protein S24e [Thermoproteota archaeon]
MSVALELKLGNEGKTFSLAEGVQVTVVREWYNKLLDRIELDLYMDHITTGTPSRAQVRDFVAKLYGVSPELVVVKRILGEYGRGASKAHVHVYRDAAKMKLVEPRYLLKRLGIEA